MYYVNTIFLSITYKEKGHTHTKMYFSGEIRGDIFFFV